MEVRGDHYATLRVAPDADDAAIRRAYRDLIRRHHPDVSPSDDAAERSSAINEAYACLRDPDKRAEYDRQRPGPFRPNEKAWGPPPPMKPFQPSWGATNVDLVSREAFAPSWRWMATSLALATVATIVTFTTTSAVDAVEPPPAAELVVMHAAVGGPDAEPR